MSKTKKVVVIRTYKCGDYQKIERIRTIEIPIDTPPEREKDIAMHHGGNTLSPEF